ncbi:Beta-N-acetylhexosaminidase [Acidipropionibacterium jensenii]|uniref:beta-N-acetylhexosaminidase n=2 Tax=Acidipropionibacterium jensenii TaxID=1749 RepID=A0A3S4UPM3_9ACTN|nr:Beta-N-acetylhexosaminidase [Acidipropionibacterium jensenii]
MEHRPGRRDEVRTGCATGDNAGPGSWENNEMSETSGPAFGWRGLGLDVSRHFFGVDDVELVIDLMAEMDLNVLHLHLSDDQGWRIEIPGWPELTERSSGSAVGGDPGGYYTLADWSRICEYAGRHGITVVPESDLPGHTTAALHALPGLNPDGRTPDLHTGIEVGFSTLSTDAPLTDRYIDEVLTQLAGLGSGWVHIGGDESKVTPHDQYRALVRRAVDAVHRAGSRVVAWQEAADLLDPGDVIQVWDRGIGWQGVLDAASRGVGVLLSPGDRAYLDMKYDPDTALGLTWAGTIELRDALEWDPRQYIPGLDPAAVVGVEAFLWSETLRTRDDLSYMLLPRLAAFSQVATRGSGIGQWQEFRSAVGRQAQGWAERGLRWHRSAGVDWPD